MSELKIVVPHHLSREEVLPRIKGLLTDLKKQFADKIKISKLREEWKGNQAKLSFLANESFISGNIMVDPSQVKIFINLPWVATLYKDKIEKIIKERATKLLTTKKVEKSKIHKNMGIESRPYPTGAEGITKETGKFKKEEKEEKEGVLFKIKKRLLGYDVTVGIEQGEKPLAGKLDFINKELEVRITPAGVKKGVEAIQRFLERSDVQEVIKKTQEDLHGWLNKTNEHLQRQIELERLKRKVRHDKELSKKIKDLSKETGISEKEIVSQFLDILKGLEENKLKNPEGDEEN